MKKKTVGSAISAMELNGEISRKTAKISWVENEIFQGRLNLNSGGVV